MSRRAAKWIAIGIAAFLASSVLFVVVLGGGLLWVLAGMSTRVVPLHIEGVAHDRDSGRPVPDCLLSYVEGRIGNTPGDDGSRSSTRTDADGRAAYSAYDSEDGSAGWPFIRRQPRVRFYVGAPPRYGSRDDVETWEVTLRFREPWGSGAEVTPEVDIQRFMAHDEILEPNKDGQPWRAAGLDPLPTGARDAKARARVYPEKDGGRPAYRIALDVDLSPSQIAACQAPAP
jgi:hypothetical protein